MKWTIEIADDSSTATITDHDGNEVTTINNDGSGITVPDDVLDVMFDVALDTYANGETEKALLIVGLMAGEQIEVVR